MGSGASTESGQGTGTKPERSVSQNEKPLDASDIVSLEAAKEEISRLRKMASSHEGLNGKKKDEGITDKTKKTQKNPKRAAVRAKALHKDYIQKSIPKSETAKKLIYNAIKQNTLFRACSEEELIDLIDAFEPVEFSTGRVVIQQGDHGEHFFVVDTGTLDITVNIGDDKSKNEVHVGVPYAPGSAFGELALMYGSPRAATIRARDECKLWSIDRDEFRGIIGKHKLKQAERHLEFLRRVKIGDKILGDVLNSSDIDAMALAIQRDTFSKNDVIVREGERGDVFYLIESGTVNVFKNIQGEEPVATLESGHFFGERALLSEDVRQATCIAASDVECLYLMREDFVLMLGDLQDLLDGTKRQEEDIDQKDTSKEKLTETDVYELNDLEIKKTLGVGAFGRVKLVKVKANKAQIESPQQNNQQTKTYALKCLSKHSIVENGLQDHVMNEKEIMEGLNHPFILKFQCAMQDNKYIYFLLEVLLGGELFKSLRAYTQFPESWSKFYAASVLLAFCQIHARKIAYRDLKPENLVMDNQGYLKIVDFGLAKKIESGKTWTLCGTPDYLAPEVILNEGHDWAVDYWALGVLIFEMTTGTPPFYADDPMEVYEKILSGHIIVPSHFNRSLTDLVKKLLKTYQSKRLGRTKGGTSAVMKHKWFSGFDWDALLKKKMRVPILPDVKSTEDTSNFDDYSEYDDDLIKDYPGWNPTL